MTPDKDLQEISESVERIREEVAKATLLAEELNRDSRTVLFGLLRWSDLKLILLVVAGSIFAKFVSLLIGV